jgi:GT2 family glycosyltransferase
LEFLRGIAGPDDWVYLGNNDTVLDAHHFSKLLEVANSGSVVGSVAKEIWPDGTVNPVSGGFTIEPNKLLVRNLAVGSPEPVDALAGRGILLPSNAADPSLFKPHRMPQHFADLAFTAALKSRGWELQVVPDAQSTQLERAGSSVELAPRIRDFLSKKSQMYLPALWNFWWDLSTPQQRLSLPVRFVSRGVSQFVSGSYR